MHQSNEQAALVGQRGQAGELLLPAAAQLTGNNFPYTFFGLEPGTTKDDIRRCLERWNEGDNGILDLSQGLSPQARHRLAGPARRPARPRLARDLRAAVGLRRLRHVPVDGRRPARPLGAAGQGRPRGQAPGPRLPRRAARLGGATSIPSFKDHHYLEPIPVADSAAEGYVDKWIVYGKVDGKELFSAKELTVQPGASVTIKDDGAYGLIVIQGTRHDRQPRRRLPGLHPLRRADRGRGLRHREAGQGRRDVQEHRHRAVRQPALLRARRPPERAGGRLRPQDCSRLRLPVA